MQLSAVEALGLCAEPPCGKAVVVQLQEDPVPSAGEAEQAAYPGVASGLAQGLAQRLALGSVQEPGQEPRQETAWDGRNDAVRAAAAQPSLQNLQGQFAALRQELTLWRAEEVERARSAATMQEQAVLVHRTLMDASAQLLGEVRALKEAIGVTRSRSEVPTADAAPSGTTAGLRWYFDSIRNLDNREFVLIRQHRGISPQQAEVEEMVYLLQVGERLARWRIQRLDKRAHQLTLENIQTGRLRSIAVGSWWQ